MVVSNELKLVFVVPSASINGAIIVLMNFLKWLKRNHKSVKIEVIVQWGKDNNPDTFFRSKLATFGNVFFLEELDYEQKISLKERYQRESVDCIFYNSIISVDTQNLLFDVNAPRVFFVHEMERLMRVFNLQNLKHLYTQHNTTFIACSASVKAALQKVLHIEESLISVIHEFINLDDIWNELGDSISAKNNSFPTLDVNREERNYDLNPFTIGLSGTFELRKSADLLPPLAHEINKRINNAKIVWVGASPFNGEPGTFDMVRNDLALAGLSNVELIPKGLGQFQHYKKFDVFVILSREDAFPVVNIEMGALGIPIICFKGSGGAEEYAATGGGVAVPFMDIGAVADQVKFYHEDKEKLYHYKSYMPQLVSRNFIVEVQAPKIFDVIKQGVISKYNLSVL